MPDLRLREIVSLDDPLYDEWLDLYQQSFPLCEQILVSQHNQAIRARRSGRTAGVHYLAATVGDGGLAAMARYDTMPDLGLAALWYLAVAPGLRGQGVGGWLYRRIQAQARAEAPGARAMLIEVELPGAARTDHDARLASRRIDFYRRGGARLIEGISYTQSVGWQPAIPMAIMLHPYAPLSAEAALALARGLLGDSMQQTGPLALR